MLRECEIACIANHLKACRADKIASMPPDFLTKIEDRITAGVEISPEQIMAKGISSISHHPVGIDLVPNSDRTIAQPSDQETGDERTRLHNHLQLIRRLQNNDSDTVPPTRIAEEGCVYPDDYFLGHGLDKSKLNAHCGLKYPECPDPM